jgi:hypothetical protein
VRLQQALEVSVIAGRPQIELVDRPTTRVEELHTMQDAAFGLLAQRKAMTPPITVCSDDSRRKSPTST